MDRRARRNLQFLATAMIAASCGAITAFRSAQAQAPPPINTLGGQQRRWRWRDNDIFITEMGEGPPIFFVHGIYAGASSFEFRYLAPLLARNHRVIAMDLLGCGLSDRPKIKYSGDLFVQQIIAAIEELKLESLVLLGSSLGGAFAIRAAAQAESRIRSVVAINPTGLEDQNERNSLRRLTEQLMLAPIIGDGLFATLASPPSLRIFLDRVYSDPSFITPELIHHYEAVTRVPGGRYVTAAFIGGEIICDPSGDLPFLKTPVHILWGEQSRIGPSNDRAKEYVALGSSVTLVTYPQSGALPHEEIPEQCAKDIEHFIHASETQCA